MNVIGLTEYEQYSKIHIDNFFSPLVLTRSGCFVKTFIGC
jgi:hypothetical protein